ncbi:VOC family protein [Rhodococcus sp. (in: high G+C Gram-positive bacteria)]|uniref:VOC family protein n=1 Tax=Rhodococcus sp. TaxID=1831 RepID=UPI00257BF402|nr:VOC family protein [Rhodococcus sp. (in: high G+C Gram-positive bacteria)]MBQ7806025.1 VOC family protein [Rhodococcus sp. (in: high G+C Gram-positive bacteria)]
METLGLHILDERNLVNPQSRGDARPRQRPYSLDHIHHLGIVVPDLDAAVAQFADLYGIAIRLFDTKPYPCRINGTDQVWKTQIGLSVGKPPHVELLRAVPDSVVWDYAPGIHHVGFTVDDLKSAANALEVAGSPIWMGGTKDGDFPTGATYHRDPFGQIVELLDQDTEARLSAQLRCASPRSTERC